MAKYDNNLIVIGGGAAGLISALIASTAGARVTLIEKGKMGGDCLNSGCIPSKTLIRSAKVAYYQANSAKYGIESIIPKVSFPSVLRNIERAIAHIAPNDSFDRYEALGVNCISGEARLIDHNHVTVNGETISARSMVLATGAQPYMPNIPGLVEAQPLTSETIWGLGHLPKRLLVLGAGAVGCEIAQSLARLGSEVTIVDIEERLLSYEDGDVSETLLAEFKNEGVNALLGYEIRRIRSVNGKSGLAYAEKKGETIELGFDNIFVATGRQPSVSGLGLEEIGVEFSEGKLKVDRYLRTSIKNIFACGDLIGPYQLTHMASHQAWHATINALFGWAWKFPIDYSVVPWATFTDPEVARVGISETEAKAQGLKVETTKFSFEELDRAVADSNQSGWVKVLTKRGSDKIVGVSIVGENAGELLAEYVLAMTHNIGLKKIMGTIHVYPTLSESSKRLAGVWRGNHAPKKVLRWGAMLQGLLR